MSSYFIGFRPEPLAETFSFCLLMSKAFNRNTLLIISQSEYIYLFNKKW